MGIHYALSTGTVDRRGYISQQKGTIYDTHVHWFHAQWSQCFAEFDWFIMITSRLDAYISGYGDFCAHDDNNNTTDYFTLCACARGNNCIIVKSGQIANPIIAINNPVPYCSVYVHVYVCESINCETYKNSQFAINRYSQLKPDLRYVKMYMMSCIGVCPRRQEPAS